MPTAPSVLATILALSVMSTATSQERPATNAGQLRPTEPSTTGEGVWLRGDLHVHSRHSRDSSNNPVAKIVAFAEEVGLDFVAITDHDNHVDGDVANRTWKDPELQSNRVLLLYGAEWTTHRGHGNTLSPVPYDHQLLYDARDARDWTIHQLKEELGVHLIANHPSGGDQFGFSYDLVDSIEVWNSVRNQSGVAVWDDMLKSGRMLTGVGGSDSHHGAVESPDEERTDRTFERAANYVGTPTTWVFATERSPRALVEALDAGRVSVSASPNVPRVELTADVDGDGEPDRMMGDSLERPPGEPVAFEVRLVGGTPSAEPFRIQVVRNGAEWRLLTIESPENIARFEDTPAAGARTYYRVEVRGPKAPYPEVPMASALGGNLVALSNPIAFGFDPDF